jgi:hypothetical protein
MITRVTKQNYFRVLSHILLSNSRECRICPYSQPVKYSKRKVQSINLNVQIVYVPEHIYYYLLILKYD